MCLGVPGKVVRWIERDPVFALAEVEFGGIRTAVHMACVEDAQEGDYVIVHAGVAICRVETQEAQRILDELRRLELLETDPRSESPSP
jgi:hydrogenase expression/formation protein HypC